MTKTTSTAAATKSFTHNGYNGGKRTTASFRIGYTEYRVWTLAGFYADKLVEDAENEKRYGWKPGAYMATLETYIASQRGCRLNGASPQGAMITSDRAYNAQRAAAFQALPEVAFGEVVLLDGVQVVVTRDNNDHVKFVPVAK